MNLLPACLKSFLRAWWQGGEAAPGREDALVPRGHEQREMRLWGRDGALLWPNPSPRAVWSRLLGSLVGGG